MTDAFWQRPKRNVNPSDYVWYDHSPMGNSTLSKIMQRISIMAGMCDNYTNHSIRSTYIPLIESICLEALGDAPGLPPVLAAVGSPDGENSSGSVRGGVLRSQSSRTEPDLSSADDSSSVTSDSRENYADSEAADGFGEVLLLISLKASFLFFPIDSFTVSLSRLMCAFL